MRALVPAVTSLQMGDAGSWGRSADEVERRAVSPAGSARERLVNCVCVLCIYALVRVYPRLFYPFLIFWQNPGDNGLGSNALPGPGYSPRVTNTRDSFRLA